MTYQWWPKSAPKPVHQETPMNPPGTPQPAIACRWCGVIPLSRTSRLSGAKYRHECWKYQQPGGHAIVQAESTEEWNQFNTPPPPLVPHVLPCCKCGLKPTTAGTVVYHHCCAVFGRSEVIAPNGCTVEHWNEFNTIFPVHARDSYLVSPLTGAGGTGGFAGYPGGGGMGGGRLHIYPVEVTQEIPMSPTTLPAQKYTLKPSKSHPGSTNVMESYVTASGKNAKRLVATCRNPSLAGALLGRLQAPAAEVGPKVLPADDLAVVLARAQEAQNALMRAGYNLTGTGNGDAALRAIALTVEGLTGYTALPAKTPTVEAATLMRDLEASISLYANAIGCGRADVLDLQKRFNGGPLCVAADRAIQALKTGQLPIVAPPVPPKTADTAEAQALAAKAHKEMTEYGYVENETDRVGRSVRAMRLVAAALAAGTAVAGPIPKPAAKPKLEDLDLTASQLKRLKSILAD